MRSQLFFDGNKRTAMLLANKILIENGLGILAVAQKDRMEFFTKIIHFYETNDARDIKLFCQKKCIETINFPKENSNAINQDFIQSKTLNNSINIQDFNNQDSIKDRIAFLEKNQQVISNMRSASEILNSQESTNTLQQQKESKESYLPKKRDKL